MSIFHTLIAILLLTLAQSASATNAATLLDKLGDQLRHARQLPVGTSTHYVCPDHPDLLVGQSRQSIAQALGKPDHRGKDEDWTYFFTSPTPAGQFGGGFPQLSFYFDRDGKVARATCYYAR